MTCADCGAQSAEGARFCVSCGAGLEASAGRRSQAPAEPTATLSAMAAPAGGTSSPSSPRSISSDSSLDHGRFLPGTVVAERYRIVGLLGRGGMGEVYRADDLRLGQAVALKFLPPDLAQDPVRLARFHNEVRLARQVSHPNVCRVHDIGDVDGQPFLSMEYVDGEDLSSLLRRIGRLPKDKAVEIARQVCAGLQAAHDQGVLHRDLKPSNVMLDGRGRARLADFGLAAAAGQAENPGARAGTPAYMAPELLSGGEASARSDIYALGLVLYELFTGKRVFGGRTLAEIVRQQESVEPTPPSTLVEDFDPVVERVILRCLEKDPKRRPATVVAVAASLPGGDPLAMALLAGETPSPEMVAAAGESGALKPVAAWACLAAVVLSLGIAMTMARASSLLALAAPPKPTQVLIDRAQTILKTAGYGDPPQGTAITYGWHRTWMEQIAATDPKANRWEALQNPWPPAYFLFYRQSPRYLVAKSSDAIVTGDDPPATLPGMVSVMISGSGELWQLNGVPPQFETSDAKAPDPDWGALFGAAGLHLDQFHPATSRWLPADYADERRAWEGTRAEAPEIPLRVEAASYRGQPIYFQVIWPWTRALRARPFEPSWGERVGNGIIVFLLACALAGGLAMARRNLRLGRGDRRGALRLAVFVFGVSMSAGVAHATHVPGVSDEWEILVRLMGEALFSAASAWIYYLALEPIVRRRWPDTIIGWTRVLSGRFNDPLVGRDLLVGVLAGTIGVAVDSLPGMLYPWLGQALPLPTVGELNVLQGPAHWVAIVMGGLALSVAKSLVALLLLVQLRIWLRRDWAAGVGVALVVALISTLSDSPRVDLVSAVIGILTGVVIAFVLVRFGVLALVATDFVHTILQNFPVAAPFGTGYAPAASFALALVAGLLVHALRSVLAGRPLLGTQAASL
ncbi:MAG TPA: protein kinase [Patescibacteria group bacterium]|nr:protein kinase [Patescibacteria group bacterium]